MRKLCSLLLALIMLLSLGVGAFASGEATGETAEPSGPRAVIVFGDQGEDAEDEQDHILTFFPGGDRTENALYGFSFQSDSSGAALLYSEVTDEAGKTFAIGGDAANLTAEEAPVSAEAAAWLAAVGVETFDSVIVLGDDEGAASCPPVISAKGWTNLTIDGTLLLAEGAARSAFYSDVSGGTTVAGPGAVGGAQGSEAPVVVVTNSLLETTGGAGTGGEISFGNAGGRARGIQPQGKSVTYLLNSAVVSRTWGAWSTDSARQGLDLVAWRSLGLSQGGYGAYADTSCHLFLYGSTVMGSSDGIVASNDGEIYAVNSDSRMNAAGLRETMGKTSNVRELSWQDYAAPTEEIMESVIAGGQAAVQFHMPDMGHSGAGNKRKGTLYMQGGTLRTDESLLQNGVEGLSAYNARYAGALLVTKSAQADIILDGVAMDSWNHVLIHTMINSDSNVNNIADGDTAVGSDVLFMNMDVEGDIIHDDYQRELRLTLDNTTFTGAIHSNTCEDWNAFCETELDGENILNPDGYETRWGVVVTLVNGATWNVTETSVIADIEIADGSHFNGRITENDDGTLTVMPEA